MSSGRSKRDMDLPRPNASHDHKAERGREEEMRLVRYTTDLMFRLSFLSGRRHVASRFVASEERVEEGCAHGMESERDALCDGRQGRGGGRENGRDRLVILTT
jgi:hypothetical protein